ncbi:hypothetical protein ACFPK9_08820 [Rubritalea spongiae]|uniref:OmpH family outer membrane protein n=1 Tax=Rubritalea spongiae TaxID=430797 RepID=A0ABW5E0Q6_9BACT
MLKTFFLATLLLAPLANADDVQDAWHELSIVSQNAGYHIHMMGVDTGKPNAKDFEKQLSQINQKLDFLVEKGVLVKKHFELKSELNIQDSVVKSVRELVGKYAPEYGIYVIREMMDIGTRQYLSEFEENAPLVLDVRLPQEFLNELTAILKKEGYKK